jgi:hypothetical protein
LVVERFSIAMLFSISNLPQIIFFVKIRGLFILV